MNKNINVLSLFDGISTGLIALKELGYKSNYYASEIEEGAISVAMYNHPEIVQLGDVTKVDGKTLPKIDLLIGGSPCNQLSSLHNTRDGLKGKDSGLFYDFVRLKEETNPKYFLLENVKMKKHDQDEITKLLGVEPININSSLVSAQLRNRLYWTNIPNIIPPEDKHIRFQDIIESGYVNRNKSNCVIESMSRQCATDAGVRRYMMGFGQLVFESQEEYEQIIGITEEDRINYSKKMRSLSKIKKLDEHIDIPKVRVLTPNEVETLQTLPKDYTNIKELYYSSKGYNKKRGDMKRISLCGEGWTKDVIKHIFMNLDF
jgi:hypothetical protein